MENKLCLQIKSGAAKGSRCFIALLLVCAMMLNFSGCEGKKTTDNAKKVNPVVIERELEPQALQTVNEATAIALRQYIYARLLTEELASSDFKTMSIEEIKTITDKAALAWEMAELFAYSSEDMANSAIMLMEDDIKPTAVNNKLQVKFMVLAANFLSFPLTAYADGGAKEFDPKTWAENLTKQYDAIKGAQRYQQLAQQIGTDARTAYEQMVIAQEIIGNQAMADAAFWDKMTKIAQATKTASKVGLFVTGTIVTGGGSLSALGASSLSLAQAGGCIVGGADCIVDIAATGSNIILGENHQVTVGFDDVKNKLAPISAVVGLASFNSGETGEQLSYIGDTLIDWFFEGKVMGVQVGEKTVTAEIFDNTGEEALKSALETAGYIFPETSKTLVQIMDELKANSEDMLARMDALVSQMAELEQAAGITEEETQTSTEEINIFGKYTFVTSYDDGETETQTISIRGQGDGSVVWTDYEGDETILFYDKSNNILHLEDSGFTIYIAFSNSGGKIIGSGYESGTLWGESFYADFTLTKVSD